MSDDQPNTMHTAQENILKLFCGTVVVANSVMLARATKFTTFQTMITL